MKRIEAIIKPVKLDDVKQAMHDAGVDGLTVIEVKGHGRQKGHLETYRGVEYRVDLLPKLMLVTIVPDEKTDIVVAAIAGAAHTGSVGDGKIFVTPVDEAVRIRTGERGPEVL